MELAAPMAGRHDNDGGSQGPTIGYSPGEWRLAVGPGCLVLLTGQSPTELIRQVHELAARGTQLQVLSGVLSGRDSVVCLASGDGLVWRVMVRRGAVAWIGGDAVAGQPGDEWTELAAAQPFSITAPGAVAEPTAGACLPIVSGVVLASAAHVSWPNDLKAAIQPDGCDGAKSCGPGTAPDSAADMEARTGAATAAIPMAPPEAEATAELTEASLGVGRPAVPAWTPDYEDEDDDDPYERLFSSTEFYPSGSNIRLDADALGGTPPKPGGKPDASGNVTGRDSGGSVSESSRVPITEQMCLAAAQPTISTSGPPDLAGDAACPEGHPQSGDRCPICEAASTRLESLVTMTRPVAKSSDTTLGILHRVGGPSTAPANIPVSGSMVLGRKPRPEARGLVGCQAVRIDVAGSELSRDHVLVTIENGRVMVADLLSTNGTWIHIPGKQPQVLSGRPTALPNGGVLNLADVVRYRLDPCRDTGTESQVG